MPLGKPLPVPTSWRTAPAASGRAADPQALLAPPAPLPSSYSPLQLPPLPLSSQAATIQRTSALQVVVDRFAESEVSDLQEILELPGWEKVSGTLEGEEAFQLR